MSASYINGVLGVLVQALLIICVAILTVLWICICGNHCLRVSLSDEDARPTTCCNALGSSDEIDAQIFTKYESDEEWTPTKVNAAYAKFYDGMCDEELHNMEKSHLSNYTGIIRERRFITSR
jgi:hypothetical protein